jgi:hypothetical protein
MRLFFSAGWAIGLLGLSWWAWRRGLNGFHLPRRPWLFLAGIALLARLTPNFVLQQGAAYDLESYQIVGQLALDGQPVYENTQTKNRHPYLPLQLYWSGLAVWASHQSGLPFAQVARLAPVLADSGISLALFAALKRKQSAQTAAYAAFLYAVNPLPVFVCAYHGQFDAIPALFTLLAFARLEGSALTSGGWLGLGILEKSWPVLALPSMLQHFKRWNGRLRFLSAAAAVPAAGVLIYSLGFRESPLAVISRAVGYNWGVGIWGWTYLVRAWLMILPDTPTDLGWMYRLGRWITLGGLGLVWWLRGRRQAPSASFLTTLVAFLALTHAFSVQYLAWIVPFAHLEMEVAWLRRYSLAAFAYMFLVYFSLILLPTITNLLPWPQADVAILMPAGLPAWLVCAAWLFRRLAGGAPAGSPVAQISQP